MKTIYLANPYSHPRLAVKEERFRAACVAAVDFFRRGEFVYSPIAHCHPMVQHGLPTGIEFHREFDRHMVLMSDELVVLTLDGWRESVGVTFEIECARIAQIPIKYMDPDTKEITDEPTR